MTEFRLLARCPMRFVSALDRERIVKALRAEFSDVSLLRLPDEMVLFVSEHEGEQDDE